MAVRGFVALGAGFLTVFNGTFKSTSRRADFLTRKEEEEGTAESRKRRLKGILPVFSFFVKRFASKQGRRFQPSDIPLIDGFESLSVLNAIHLVRGHGAFL